MLVFRSALSETVSARCFTAASQSQVEHSFKVAKWRMVNLIKIPFSIPQATLSLSLVTWHGRLHFKESSTSPVVQCGITALDRCKEIFCTGIVMENARLLNVDRLL